MRSHIFAAGALITAGILGSANAADLPMPAPAYSAPPAPVYNWTGCYVGGGGGYAFWQQDSFVTVGGTAVTASQSNGVRAGSARAKWVATISSPRPFSAC